MDAHWSSMVFPLLLMLWSMTDSSYILLRGSLELYLPTGESSMATTICQYSAESMVSKDACLSAWSTVLSSTAHPTSAALRKEPTGFLPRTWLTWKGAGRAMLTAVVSIKARSLNNVTRVQHLPEHHQLLLFHKEKKGIYFPYDAPEQTTALRESFPLSRPPRKSCPNHLATPVFVPDIDSQQNVFSNVRKMHEFEDISTNQSHTLLWAQPSSILEGNRPQSEEKLHR